MAARNSPSSISSPPPAPKPSAPSSSGLKFSGTDRGARNGGGSNITIVSGGSSRGWGGGSDRGGAVLLVAATMFIGYLYLTGRLQKVIQVLAEPAPGSAGASDTSKAPHSDKADDILLRNAGIKVPTSGTPPFNPASPGYGWVPRGGFPKWRGDPSGYEGRR